MTYEVEGTLVFSLGRPDVVKWLENMAINFLYWSVDKLYKKLPPSAAIIVHQNWACWTPGSQLHWT